MQTKSVTEEAFRSPIDPSPQPQLLTVASFEIAWVPKRYGVTLDLKAIDSARLGPIRGAIPAILSPYSNLLRIFSILLWFYFENW
jgi:hypothetical protein